MKKLLLLFLLGLFSVNAFSQVVKEEAAPSEVVGAIKTIGGEHFSLHKSGNEYTLYYRDSDYIHIDNYKYFSFKDLDGDLDYMYNTILEGFKKLPETTVYFELPNDRVVLDYAKALGITNVRFLHTDGVGVTGTSYWLTKKKLKKLFGK